ncbi:MAG: hypothetical protein JXA20_13085 [Spirochaetes bacterium]|nr:hypothetical protein [Spirochaetota bacterium]
MKRRVSLLTGLLLCGVMAWADEIHLLDGTVLRGRVVRVTDAGVKYTEQDGGAEKTVPSRDVKGIRYEDGEEFSPKGAEAMDRLTLKDGHEIEGKVVRVADTYVIFRKRGDEADQILSRDLVGRISYGDGQVVEAEDSGADAKTGKEGDGAPREPVREEKRDSQRESKNGDADAATGSGDYRARMKRFSARVTVSYMSWKPPWREIGDGLYASGTYDYSSAFMYGIELSARIWRRLWISGQFQYGKFDGEGNVNVFGGLFRERVNCRNDLINANFLIRMDINRYADFNFGVNYYRFYERGSEILYSSYSAIVYPVYHSNFNSFGPRIGFGLELPLFWRLQLQGDLGAGALFGKYLHSFTETVSWCIDATAGIGMQFPDLHLAVALQYGIQYQYFSRHDNPDIGDGADEYLHGVTLSVAFVY